MKAIVCEMCGSQELMKQDGIYVCQNCGTKYSLDDAKKLLVEVDNSEKLNNYYSLARRARENRNAEDAQKYYDLIRQEAPDDWEANFYSVFYKAIQCKIAEIASAANSVANCVFSTFSLINDHVYEEDRRVEAVNEICDSSFQISDLLKNEANRYFNGIAESIKSRYAIQWTDNMQAVRRIKNEVCRGLSVIFKGDVAVQKAGLPYLINFVQLGYNDEIERQYLSVINKLDPDYDHDEFLRKREEKIQAARQNANQKSGGCYVATAVYGSYDCPEVWTLRRYRDYTLAETWYGRAFIHTYYAISPSLVKWFGKTEWFRNL